MTAMQNWLIETVIRQHALVSIESTKEDLGVSGAVMVDQACSIATGTPWHGNLRTSQGSVVYVAARNPQETKNQIRAWCQQHQVSQATIEQHLRFWEGPLELRDTFVVATFAHAVQDGTEGILHASPDADGQGATFLLGFGPSPFADAQTYPKMQQVAAIFIDDYAHCATYGAGDPVKACHFLRDQLGASVITLVQKAPQRRIQQKRPVKRVAQKKRTKH